MTVAVTVLAAVEALGSSPPSLDARPVWAGDFESGDFSQYDEVFASRSEGVRIVDRDACEGRYAGFFTVHPGDRYEDWSGERSQALRTTGESEGVESLWQWYVRLPRDHRSSGTFFEVVVEWHHAGPTGSPPVTFQISKGHHVVRVIDSSDPAASNQWTEYGLGPIVPGECTRFAYHVRWSSDPSKAFNRIYRDGRLVRDITGHPNLFVGLGNYLLVGWYRGEAGVIQSVMIDGVRRYEPPVFLRARQNVASGGA